MIEALREQSTLADIARKHEISQAQLSRWKKEFLSNAAAPFGGSDQQQEIKKLEAERDSCHRKIGELQMDLDFAKRVPHAPHVALHAKSRLIRRNLTKCLQEQKEVYTFASPQGRNSGSTLPVVLPVKCRQALTKKLKSLV